MIFYIAILFCIIHFLSVAFVLQLKAIIARTLDTFIALFIEEETCRIPLFKMELILDDEDNIQFYPMLGDLEESILSVVRSITSTLQTVQTVQVQLVYVAPSCDLAYD